MYLWKQYHFYPIEVYTREHVDTSGMVDILCKHDYASLWDLYQFPSLHASFQGSTNQIQLVYARVFAQTLPALYFHTHSSTVICLSLTLFRIICFFHTSSGSFNASFWCRIICLLWFLISSQTQTLSLSVSSFRWARSRKQILCQRLPATKCLHTIY